MPSLTPFAKLNESTLERIVQSGLLVRRKGKNGKKGKKHRKATIFDQCTQEFLGASKRVTRVMSDAVGDVLSSGTVKDVGNLLTKLAKADANGQKEDVAKIENTLRKKSNEVAHLQLEENALLIAKRLRLLDEIKSAKLRKKKSPGLLTMLKSKLAKVEAQIKKPSTKKRTKKITQKAVGVKAAPTKEEVKAKAKECAELQRNLAQYVEERNRPRPKQGSDGSVRKSPRTGLCTRPLMEDEMSHRDVLLMQERLKLQAARVRCDHEETDAEEAKKAKTPKKATEATGAKKKRGREETDAEEAPTEAKKPKKATEAKRR